MISTGSGVAEPFLTGGGDMALRIAGHDWSGSLGPVAAWPVSLKTTVGLMLHSPVPLVLLWSTDGIMIYNDAYSQFAGARHPSLLGSKVREGWPEVADWNDNVMKVGMAGGTLSYREQELVLNRRGQMESCWLNLDYSPVIDESGQPGGVIAIVVEITEQVEAARALAQTEQRLQTALSAGRRHRPQFVRAPNCLSTGQTMAYTAQGLFSRLPTMPADKGHGDDLEAVVNDPRNQAFRDTMTKAMADSRPTAQSESAERGVLIRRNSRGDVWGKPYFPTAGNKKDSILFSFVAQPERYHSASGYFQPGGVARARRRAIRAMLWGVALFLMGLSGYVVQKSVSADNVALVDGIEMAGALLVFSGGVVLCGGFFAFCAALFLKRV